MFFLNSKSEYWHFQVRGFSNIARILQLLVKVIGKREFKETTEDK